MKFIYCLFLIVLLSNILIAQKPTVQDCLGAIPICNMTYDEPDPYGYSGNGNYLAEIDTSKACFTRENNGIWYTFIAQSEGKLRFTITPHNANDDYDWIVFNLTNSSCSQLKGNTAKYVVSSNNYGSKTENGPTGANSQYSQDKSGNCNGPGDKNVPKWNDDITVIARNVYYLYIANYTGSKKGYLIDFNGSTPNVVVDNLGPGLSTVQSTWPGQKEITINFSENVECNSVAPDDFLISDSGRILEIAAIYSDVCDLGGQSCNNFKITMKEGFLPGNYTIDLVGQVNDPCKNAARNSSLKFLIPEYPKSKVEVPKAFTPNNDGVNDKLIIKNIIQYPNAIIKIFNRWSKLVFEGTGSDPEWDGTSNGKVLPMDSYFYFIDLKDGSEPIIGYFTLIK
jgi:gliding motility-associated-like protein